MDFGLNSGPEGFFASSAERVARGRAGLVGHLLESSLEVADFTLETLVFDAQLSGGVGHLKIRLGDLCTVLAAAISLLSPLFLSFAAGKTAASSLKRPISPSNGH